MIKSQHTKLTLVEKILPLLPLRIKVKLATFRSQVWSSTNKLSQLPPLVLLFTSCELTPSMLRWQKRELSHIEGCPRPFFFCRKNAELVRSVCMAFGSEVIVHGFCTTSCSGSGQLFELWACCNQCPAICGFVVRMWTSRLSFLLCRSRDSLFKLKNMLSLYQH